MIRFNVVETNFYASYEVAKKGFDVVDVHFAFLLQTMRNRGPDGIHWNPEANRLISNMILSHYALSLSRQLPNRSENLTLLQAFFGHSEKTQNSRKNSKLKPKAPKIGTFVKNF